MVNQSLILYTADDISSRIKLREGESKLGEHVHTIPVLTLLAECPAKFVLVGIPEDIGVRANQGIAGASTSWQPALTALLNMQENGFLSGSELLVLGHFDFSLLSSAGVEELPLHVSRIDEQVYVVLKQIFLAGKVPVIIGGGHNNAYPILKAFAGARRTRVNVLNIDAHADLRPTTGRHSGNGFSYAIQDGYLGRYGIFGLRQSHLTKYMQDVIEGNNNITVAYYEDMLKEADVQRSWERLSADVPEPLGLEIDLDSIQNVLSSASSPTGFSVQEIRRIMVTNIKKLAYLHLAEGAVELADGRRSNGTAKLLAILVCDFIKAQR